MMNRNRADQEATRLLELKKYNIVDTLSEKDYDNITQMASIICDVPISLVSFIDEKRQWFKSHKGIPITETPRDHSFCAHLLNSPSDVFIVPDSRTDDRFCDNPYVTGEPNIVFYAGVPLINENGYMLGAVCVIDQQPRELLKEQLEALKILSSQVMNLLELRKTNLDLSATTQRLQLAMEAGKLGSYDLDLKTGETKMSFNCKQNFGLAQTDEISFSELLMMILPEDRDAMQSALDYSINRNVTYNAEYRIKLANGEIRWIHTSGTPLYNADGDAILMAGVTINTTAQKNFTSELEKQVLERTNELKQKNQELESINNELQSFAFVSSHDLQEPLRKIRTFSMRILAKDNDTLSDQAKDDFYRIQSAATRMQRLIDDLLAYSRTNNSERIYEYTDLNTIVDALKEDFKEEILLKEASIEAINLGHIRVIPFQFKQLLQNLFSNSIKFSNPDVPLTIKISSETDTGFNLKNEQLSEVSTYCHLVVSDNGIGFDPQYSERIFEIFQRLNSRYEYEGTGIGLAIVKKIVENHRGIITASSELNKGATFDIYFPVSDDK